MSWRDLLDAPPITAPWLGGPQIHLGPRSWWIRGEPPVEHGWYRWWESGRVLYLLGEGDIRDAKPLSDVDGYLHGDYLVPESDVGRGDIVRLLPAGLPHFTRISAARYSPRGQLVFLSETFPLGPEDELRACFEDRGDITKIKGVTPALEAVYRRLEHIRDETEARRARVEAAAQAERERAQLAERAAEIARTLGTGQSRRELARTNFEAAAVAALSIGGADLLGFTRGPGRAEYTVRYRTAGRRFECVVDVGLNVLDAGICLDGDDELCTLETLPVVVREAIARGVLHVYRNI